MSSEEIADLKKASGGAVNLTVCDITNEAAVKAWAGEVANLNEGRLDLLISNAGILTSGPLEVLPLSAIRHEFEVNVRCLPETYRLAEAYKVAAFDGLTKL